MKMQASDIRKWPKFHEYVSVRIPEVRNVPFIVNAFKKFSGNTSMEAIKEGLLWNKSPMIKITPGLICAGVAASGCQTDGVDEIEIKEERIQDFEDGKDVKHTATGKLVYYVGVTLLHEYCHWLNDGTGETDLTHAKFEQTLYGKVINVGDK